MADRQAEVVSIWRVAVIVTGFCAICLYALQAHATLAIIMRNIVANRFYSLGDFTTMWRAGFLIRSGDPWTLYHSDLFDAWMLKHFAGGFAGANWLYGPPMGLLSWLVSLLSLPLAFWIWRFGGIILTVSVLRLAGLAWWVIAAGLAGPVMFYDIELGQNGALTGGLLVGALLLIERRPVLAGLLASCLMIKPQIGVLLPAAMLHRRSAAALAVAAVAAVVLIVLSGALEGWQSWLLFFNVAQPTAARILAIPFGQGFQLAGFTVLLAARSLGSSLRFAYAVQFVCSATAFVGVWFTWRLRGVDPTSRMVITVCLSALAMPYGFSYDLTGFSVAVAALAPRATLAQLPLLIAVWLWPGMTSLLTLETGIVLFPIAAVLGAALAAAQLRPAEALTRRG